MANENHNLRIGIDASQAKRGAAAYTAAIDKIAKATRDFQQMSADMGKNLSKSGSFAAVARDLGKLNTLRLNPSLAKNVQALSSALSGFRGPSRSSVTNLRTLVQAMGRTSINPSLGRSLGTITTALSNFRGPNRGAANNTQQFLRTLNGMRLNTNIGSSLAALSSTFNNFQGPSAQVARNIQAFAQALAQVRVPPGLGRLSTSLNALNGRFGSTSQGALRLGGSVNGIPWGRASQGAIQLTGNLRGLENAMSLSYQMGSQLRTVFGALTISGFTSAVVEASTTSDRLRYLLGAVSEEVGEVERMMDFAQATANKYGLSLLEVQRQFGRFAAAGRSTGLSEDQTQYVFESLASQMRLFGLNTQQQERAMLAITQMFQKGAVQAEEFKTQLGEQLPVFAAMRNAMAKITGDENVDIMKMMEQGMIGSDAILFMLQEMEQLYGKGIPDALKNPLVGMQNLQNAWTEFLKLVGGAGVMDALGEVSWAIADIMRTEDFQSMAKSIAEGLANGIRKAGEAAKWFLQNIEMVGKVLVSLIGVKAISTVVALGGAFGGMAAQATASVLAVRNLGGAIMGAMRGASLMAALPVLIGGITSAFAIAGIAAGAALALMWDNTVKLGETITTVGAMARVAFEDMGNWAQWAGQEIVTLFTQGAEIAGTWFTAMNQQVSGGSATWEDWAKTILGLIHLVGSTMTDVFRAAWRLVVQNTIDAFNIIYKTVQGIGAAFNMVGALAKFDGGGAATFAAEAGAAFGEVERIGKTAFKETGDVIAGTFLNAQQRTEEYVKGLDWVTANWDSNRDAVINYFDEIAKRSTDPKYNPQPDVRTPAEYTAPEFDAEGLNALNKEYKGAADALTSVGKRAKEAEDATKTYKAEVAALDEALSSGKITLDQYNDSLKFHAGKLEEVSNPYAAMIRGMQEEANMLRLNGREQRVAAAFQDRRNQLLEKGVSLTSAQTEELKAMVAELDKLQNPSPLQAWVDGMQDFGDAIETAGVQAMEGLSDSIADLIVDGKADWQSLFKSITKDLIKLSLNELWKPMFGNKQAQQAVNAPDVSSVLSETDSITGMATAVAQGIRLAGGMGYGTMQGFGNLGNDVGTSLNFADMQALAAGLPADVRSRAMGAAGASGFGTLGNDIGGPLNFNDLKSLASGTTNGVGGGAGTFQDFQSIFGAPQSMAGGGASGAVDLAETMLGKHEKINTGDINSFLRAGGVDINAAQTAWCAGFVNSSLEQMGIKGNGSLVATDFMKWGNRVDPGDVMRGDVMIKHNGKNPGETGGHVGFATGQTRMGQNGMEMQMLSGNASNQVQYDWYRADQVQLRRAMEQQTQAAIPPGMPGQQMVTGAAPMGGAMGQMMTPTATTMTGLPGAAAMPGMGVPGMGMAGGGQLAGLGDAVKAEMTPAFQEIATAVPGQFQPSFTQIAQQLPQKLVPQGDTLATQLASAAQPGNLQAAQDNAQKYQEANTQAANDFAMKMQQAGGGMGGVGGAMGGGGGGMLGGLGGIFGMFGNFAAVGATVGSAGGTRRPLSTILGDPDAEPIVAHRGELITPANEVNRMRRMGDEAMLLDNAAVRESNRRGGNDSVGGSSSDGTTVRQPTPRPIVNFNITTPNADSFRASQSQINAKAGAAAYRDAARNR